MNENLSQIGIDIGEVALDAVFDDGILKDIPILGTIANAAKITRTIRDRLLINKIREFLIPCSDLSSAERSKFGDRLEGDESFRTRVEETIILYLDRCDALRKAKVMGSVFNALVREEINIETYIRLNYCIDRSYVDDLFTLGRYPKLGEKGHRTSNAESIALSNLVKESGVYEIHITPLGITLLDILNRIQED